MQLTTASPLPPPDAAGCGRHATFKSDEEEQSGSVDMTLLFLFISFLHFCFTLLLVDVAMGQRLGAEAMVDNPEVGHDVESLVNASDRSCVTYWRMKVSTHTIV
jgi:hypothetical protein